MGFFKTSNLKPDAHSLHSLGVEITQIMAVAGALITLSQPRPASSWWLCRIRPCGSPIFFHPERYEGSVAFPDGGALLVEDKSKIDARLDGHRRLFEWNITLILQEDELESDDGP